MKQSRLIWCQVTSASFCAIQCRSRCAEAPLTFKALSGFNRLLPLLNSAPRGIAVSIPANVNRAMNIVLWITQFFLAGTFVFTRVGKVLAYNDLKRAVEARTKGAKNGKSRALAVQVGLLEGVGAVGLVLPLRLMAALYPAASSGRWIGAAEGDCHHLPSAPQRDGRSQHRLVSCVALCHCWPLAIGGRSSSRLRLLPRSMEQGP